MELCGIPACQCQIGQEHPDGEDEEEQRLTPLDLIRPQGTGTTAEGVGGQHR